MAGDYSKKTQSADRHLANLTSSRFIHVDGSAATPFTRTKPCRLLSVAICSKGVACTISTGGRVVCNIATTTVETTLIFGEYLENGMTISGVSGSGSINISFDE